MAAIIVLLVLIVIAIVVLCNNTRVFVPTNNDDERTRSPRETDRRRDDGYREREYVRESRPTGAGSSSGGAPARREFPGARSSDDRFAGRSSSRRADIFVDRPRSGVARKRWMICQLDSGKHIVKEALLPSSIINELTVGRESSCGFVIEDPEKKVSRFHAVIRQDSRGLYLQEVEPSMRSSNSNGIWLDGKRMTSKIYLRDRLVVYLADTPVGFYVEYDE